ncbi:MAG TPA: helix-turn-helix transcriptional regulator [Pseudonocardiaceae bacterium]|jgi:transcriptional regulator with XRE-family HTH domain|nr:helix-turn-helix transcriptional regulator [Pseudonocardiaceae bacterium]
MTEPELKPWAISLYARTLGDVIRHHRKAKGWTRKQLQEQLPDSDVSLQTLATYELGTRHLSVERLDEIARTLGTRAHAILAEVDQRVYGGASEKLVVNLAELARSNQPDIAPAAKWAAIQVDALDGIAQPIAEFSTKALDMLANVCDLDMADLSDLLRELA